MEKNGPPLIRTAESMPAPARVEAFSLGALLDDRSPMPEDIIAPRVLTPGGLLVLGGAPKVGKSDFLISWLVHMAAGQPFLGFAPPRPLRVFYLQAEIQYHYLRERLQAIPLDPSVLAAARDTFVATPKLKLLLDGKGLALAIEAVREAFPDAPPDILCLDPIRNLFDGGPEGGGENDNTAMMFFLTERVEALREAVNPDGGRDPRPPHQQARQAPGQGGSVPRPLRRQRAARVLHLRPPHAPARRGAAPSAGWRSSCATGRRCLEADRQGRWPMGGDRHPARADWCGRRSAPSSTPSGCASTTSSCR